MNEINSHLVVYVLRFQGTNDFTELHAILVTPDCYVLVSRSLISVSTYEFALAFLQ